MTADLGKTIYISDAQGRLEDYRQHMIDRGLKARTASAKLSLVRVGLKEILEIHGNIPLASIDTEIMRASTERHSTSGLNTRQRIAAMATFIKWCIGEYPEELTGAMSYSLHKADVAFIRARYAEELAHMADAMKAEGRTKETTDNLICDSIVCLTALVSEFGPRPLSEIGVPDMEWLEGNLGKSEDRRHICMRSFGRLVSSAVGRDPYHEFRTRNSAVSFEERLLGVPFGEEILEMAEWMECHNYRPATILSRVKSLASFMPRLTEILGDFELEDVTLDTFYLIRSKLGGLAERTQASYMLAFESLIQYSTGHKVYDGHRMMWNNSTVKRTFITKDEWKIILANAGKTDRMAIMLASLLGMRLSEIVNLRLEDMTETEITIHGKGHGVEGKVVVKTIPPMLRKEIDDYMGFRQLLISRYSDASEGRFLINDCRNICGPMTRNGLSGRLKALSNKVGIPFSAHTFRRFYACTLYHAGVPTDVIMRMMRHENIETTLRCYIQADPVAMKDAEDALEQQLFR